MKIYAALVATLTLSFSAVAQVLPHQAGEYTGTFKARTVTTDSSLDERTKSSVFCSIQLDGSTEITSGDGLLINGNLIAGEKYGFFSMSNEFVTGTGLWKFNSRGNVKGGLLYGIRPGGDVVFVVNSKIKLRKEDFQTAR